MSDYTHYGFGGIGVHDPKAVYTKPPAVPSDEAEYHSAAQWHVCFACNESWLCHEKHAHGHPGCPGTPYVFRPLRGEPVPPLRPSTPEEREERAEAGL